MLLAESTRLLSHVCRVRGEGRIEGWRRQEGETGEERERQKGAGGEGGVHGGGAVVLYAGQYN